MTTNTNTDTDTFNPYTEAGYTSRTDYLESLAKNYGVPLNIVLTAAQMLGRNEDFDGLLTTIEDYADSHDCDE